MPHPSSLLRSPSLRPPLSSSVLLLRPPSLRRSHATARVSLVRPYHTTLYYNLTKILCILRPRPTSSLRAFPPNVVLVLVVVLPPSVLSRHCRILGVETIPQYNLARVSCILRTSFPSVLPPILPSISTT
ncbi:hypothetical protein BP00DRAFT_32502 [Aspergillus indologenus CBS 114.80]|uniref:Uncharacterized protein n=1 Tax=Aspergillus indologenus CBS 114.80 TaxID=1450541 RepID=A0A2V5HTM8_9EURO|nr:hypothetical protein BP00DRAFT_32502 [Aspergillus indologenus CBS 114.80]